VYGRFTVMWTAQKRYLQGTKNAPKFIAADFLTDAALNSLQYAFNNKLTSFSPPSEISCLLEYI